MRKYKCRICQEIKEEGSKVVFVEDIDSNLKIPTCSLECAEELKKE